LPARRSSRPAVVVLSSGEYYRLCTGSVKTRESFVSHLIAFSGSETKRADAKLRDISF
jgi:hypothetical protein